MKTSTCLVFILGSGWYQNQKDKTDQRTVLYVKLASCMTKFVLTGPEFHLICHFYHRECSGFRISMHSIWVFSISSSLLFMCPYFDTKLGCDPFVFCFQEITGSVFYLALDVVDTKCHVLSKKLWKNCNRRPAHSTVKILFFFLISHMMSYSGTTDDSKIPTLAFLVGNKAEKKNQSPFYNIQNFTLYLLISL